MNILILIFILIILSYVSKLKKKKIIKDCPECKKYRKYTKLRLIHLNTLNLKFNNKSVLEIGAKDTSFSRYFLSQKANVTISSPIDLKIKKFKKTKLNINYFKLNIENPINLPKYDYIVCYGVIEHMQNPLKSIKWMSKQTDILIIESSVSNLFNDKVISVPYKKHSKDLSLNKYGSRFSRKTLMNILQNNFKYVYSTKSQPEHEKYPKNWNKLDLNKHLSLNIRSIFVASNKLLENNNLLFNLPNIQN